jgi:hypothetical protein
MAIMRRLSFRNYNYQINSVVSRPPIPTLSVSGTQDALQIQVGFLEVATNGR